MHHASVPFCKCTASEPPACYKAILQGHTDIDSPLAPVLAQDRRIPRKRVRAINRAAIPQMDRKDFLFDVPAFPLQPCAFPDSLALSCVMPSSCVIASFDHVYSTAGSGGNRFQYYTFDVSSAWCRSEPRASGKPDIPNLHCLRCLPGTQRIVHDDPPLCKALYTAIKDVG